ncbi:MAG: hypothetical protein AAFR10_09070 [Pseudomonadota bacterium]
MFHVILLIQALMLKMWEMIFAAQVVRQPYSTMAGRIGGFAPGGAGQGGCSSWLWACR